MQKIEGELINYGFSEDLVEIEKEAYILGVNSKIPNIVQRPDGEWPDILYEPQAEKYETSGCTIWGGENQIEFFLKGVYGFEPNYDERFSYLHCNVDPSRGANPQNFYESVRHEGLIDNETMPPTLQEFLDKSYLTKERKQKGLSWLSKWNFWHDWLGNTSKETIKDTLRFSPIDISVTAWFRDEDGLYVDNGRQNTHWCVAYGYVKPNDDLTRFQVNQYTVKTLVAKGKIILKVFDSYDHSHKLLHPDHRIAYAKRIYLEPKGEGEEEVLVKSGVLDKLFAVLKRLSDFLSSMGRLGSTTKGLIEQLKRLVEALSKLTTSVFISPDIDEDVIFQPSKDELLEKLAKAIEKFEDYVPPGGKYRDGKIAPNGSLTYRCNNPGACRFYPFGYHPKYGKVREYREGLTLRPGQRGFAQFETKEIGMMYLKNLILQKARRHPTWNLYEFFGDEKDGWAPTSDNNHPKKYAEFVAREMKVNPYMWKLNEL